MKRSFSKWIMLIALVLPFILVACGGSENVVNIGENAADDGANTGNDDAANQADDEAMDNEAMDDEDMADVDPVYGDISALLSELDGTTVVFWHQHSGGREETLNQIINDFNATNEWGVVVEGRNEGGYDDIYDKMIAGLTTGDVPGLVVAYQNQAAAYQVADGLVSLDPYINNADIGLNDEDVGDFYGAFIASDRLPQFGGDSFGFPPNRSMEVMYYNADWLAELGYDAPPQTPEEFAEMTCAAAENPFSLSPDPSFSYGYEVRTDASNVASLTFARGADVYDYAANQFTYNNPATADGLQQMADLLAEGCVTIIAERFGDQSDFGNGKVLFTMGSSSGLPFYASAVNDGETGGFSWSVAPIPYTTDEPVMNIYGASVSIPQTDPKTQLAAWLFLRYYTSPDVQASWAVASNYFPVRESVADGLGDYFGENPAYEAAFNLLPFSKAEPPVAGYDNIRDAAEQAFIRVLDGEDPATVLAELDEEANSILAEAAP